MDAFSIETAVRARYVLPVVGPPIEHGVISVVGGRIASVGRTSDLPVLDLGNAAILPGLVNAHTHLEFSELKKPLGDAGMPLPHWIRRVIGYRREHPVAAQSAVPLGVAESLRSGNTSLGEISTTWSPDWSLPDVATVFREVIGLDRQQISANLDRTRQALQQIPQSQRGLSPHAPYSVHPELFDALIDSARQAQLPVAMHLAESPEELELLRTGRGLFRELLEELGVWRDDANPVGRPLLDYLQRLSDAPRSLVVHGNYLGPTELAFLGQHADRMAVVYCPRTHDYFRHSPYPLSQMLDHSVTVCLGTDSRASNPDLSLFEDLKFAATRHAVSPQLLLQMATLNGARMLASYADFGAISPGMRADLALVQLPERRATDPYDLLFDAESRVVATYLAGKLVASGH